MILDSLLRDLRYGARSLIRDPGFTVIAVLILALAIGANSTIFTLVSSLFLESPPEITEPHRLVRINRSNERTRSGSMSYPDYRYHRERNSVFNGLAASAFDPVLVMVSGADGGVQAEAMLVSDNFFDVLGVRPALGRGLASAAEERAEYASVIVVSDGFWRRELGGDPDVIGTDLELNGHHFTVAGVAPVRFRGVSPLGPSPDLWAPLEAQPLLMPTGGDMLRRVPGEVQVWLQGIGRLRPGVDLEAARDNMSSLALGLEEEFPSWNEGQGIAVTEHFQYSPAVRDRLVSLTRLLMAVVSVVLLIACANLAILLLARASARERELGVRRALGAGRGRIVRLMLTEGLALALAGGLAGLGIAIWASDAAAALLPVSVSVPIQPDLKVLGFTLGLCAVTTFVFGLAPAWSAAGSDIADVIRGASRVTRRSPFRSVLVVAQLALAIVLVSGAALFLRSFVTAQSVDVGFEIDDRALVRFDLRVQGYEEEGGRRFILEALDRVAELPGVGSVTTTRMVPLGGGMWTAGFQAEGAEPPPGQDYFDVGVNAVGPAYFETLGIPLLAGRAFTRSDDSDAPGVVVVNETLADMVWPGQDPLGKVITHDDRFTVVGVARDATYYELGETPQPQLYVPVLQVYQSRVNLIVHARGDAADLTRPIQAELRALDPGLIIASARTLEDVFADTLGGYRVLAALVSIFGALALVLSAVGLYGVMSYLVAQRTREFGVRVALGARRKQVIGLVLGRGLKLALAGIAAGTLIAWMAARAVHGFLFGIGPHDPVTFVAVPIALAAVAAVAAYVPARRAASIDPMRAIRHE